MVRIRLPSTLLLAISSKTDVVRRITFDPFSKSDPHYILEALLGLISIHHVGFRTPVIPSVVNTETAEE